MEGKVYEKDNLLYDRVTAVLDWVGEESLAAWRGKVGNKEANAVGKAARNIGSETHGLIAARLLGKMAPPPKKFEVAQAFKAWERWHALNPMIGTKAVETTVYDSSLLLAGTPDLWTDTELFDWKVSSRITWKHRWQVNFYCHLVRSSTQNQPWKWRIVRLDKTLAEFEEESGVYDHEMKEAFFGLVKAYKYWRLMTKETEDAVSSADSTDASD